MCRNTSSSTRWLPVVAGLLSTAVTWTTACSSSSSNATDGGAGGDGSASSSSGSSSGSGGSSGSSSGGSGSSSGGSSSVIISQGPDGQGGTTGSVIAQIGEHYASGASGAMCTTTTSGQCQVHDCSAVLGADANPGMTVDDNAGTITVSGGSLTMPAMLTFMSDDTYSSETQASALFAAGATFQISAPGATFPAFSGTSAPAPGAITISSPTPTSGMLGPVYPIDPTKAATFSWSGGTAGADVELSVINNDTSIIVECTFDASAGTGTIPANVVATFPSGTTSIPQPLVVGVVTTKDVGSGVSVVVQNALGATFFATQ